MPNPLILALQAEHHINENVPNPYLIGGGVLAFLLLLLFAVVAFGGGREHS